MTTSTGKFVVLEGISGSGKSTIHKLLEKRFPDAFCNVEPTHLLFGAVIRSVYERRPFPAHDLEQALEYTKKGYGREGEDFWLYIAHVLDQVKLGQKISELDMQLLFMADRVYDLVERIGPARASGKMVLQDRYFASTLAYGGSGGVDREKMVEWQMKAFNSFGLTPADWQPDLMIMLDLDAKIAMARLKSSGKVIDVFEEKLERLIQIHKNYRALIFRKNLFPKTVLLDANAPIEKVLEQAVSLISPTTAPI
ncbi:hypothetical protein KGO95_02210 [Patescibacteria group bacterium]|nr:hypothetical protein [Patescibacteria group bacterium]